MKKINSYSKFNNIKEEVENPLDKDYLEDVEKRSREKHKIQLMNREIDPNNFMSMVNKLQSIQSENDNIPKLEKLAKKIMESEFGLLLENIELDYSIVKSDDEDLKDMADEMEMEMDGPTNDEEHDEERDNKDEKLSDEIDKRKLINNIIQGAAKNTHRIIHTEIAKKGLNDIDIRLFPLIDKLIKTNEFIEWQISPEMGMGMMKNNPAGAVKIELDRDDNDNDDNDDNDDNEDKDKDETQKITVNAKAIDFIILLHELVKGVYEALALRGTPSDISMLEDVLSKTDTLKDEFYDLRNGPVIKNDIDEFILKNVKMSKIENSVEFFYGAFMELSAKDFVHLFKEIIKKTDFARNEVDKMIDEVLDPIIEWYREEDMRLSGIGMDEPEDQEETEMETDSDSESEIDSELDYSLMSKRDLQIEMDDALDNEDFDKAREIGKYL